MSHAHRYIDGLVGINELRARRRTGAIDEGPLEGCAGVVYVDIAGVAGNSISIRLHTFRSG